MAATRFEQLTAVLHDPSASLDELHDAARALTFEIGDPRVDILLQLLERNEVPELRFELVYDLGELADPRAFEPLCRILQDRSEGAELRGLSAELLHRFENVDAVPVLVAALDDREPRVRFDAAWSLAIVGDHRARAALERHTGDGEYPYMPDQSVGDVARQALERITAAAAATGSAEGRSRRRRPKPAATRATKRTPARRPRSAASPTSTTKPSRRKPSSVPRPPAPKKRRAGKRTRARRIRARPPSV